MDGGLSIRLYDHRRDGASFRALNFRTFRDSIPPGEGLDEAAFLRHYDWLLSQFAPHDPARSTVFVAEFKGHYAGHVWLGTQTDFFTRQVEPWVFDLSVIPELRGRGIARALHDHALAFLRKRGARSVGLQVMAHNGEAAAVYVRLGYKLRASSLQMKL